MVRRTAFLMGIVVMSLMIPCLYSADKPYSTGKIIEIQQETRDKVDLYLVNTPVTTAVPYFEISVEFGNSDYVAEYTPRHSGEELPEAWKPGGSVRRRIEKHFLYLQRPEGTELKFIIDKRTAVKPSVVTEQSQQ